MTIQENIFWRESSNFLFLLLYLVTLDPFNRFLQVSSLENNEKFNKLKILLSIVAYLDFSQLFAKKKLLNLILRSWTKTIPNFFFFIIVFKAVANTSDRQFLLTSETLEGS
jgi:hypothetical protein